MMRVARTLIALYRPGRLLGRRDFSSSYNESNPVSSGASGGAFLAASLFDVFFGTSCGYGVGLLTLGRFSVEHRKAVEEDFKHRNLELDDWERIIEERKVGGG